MKKIQGQKNKIYPAKYIALKELDIIIEEFERAMRNAYRPYVSKPKSCEHDTWPRFTPHMHEVWEKYVQWCRDNPTL